MFISLFITMGLWLTLLLEIKKYEQYLKEEDYSLHDGFSLWLWMLFVIALLFGGFINGCFLMTTPMHIYIIGAIIFRVLIFWLAHELTDEKAFLRKLPDLSSKSQITFAIVAAILFIATFIWPAFCQRTIGYTKASIMLNTIDDFETGTVEMFPEVTPEMLRLTTSKIARSIAEIKRTSAASTVTSVHLGLYKSTLCWICTLSEPPIFGWLLLGDSNRIREIIVVPVTDATGENTIVVPINMAYNEGLWFRNNIFIHGTNMFPFRTFTRGYVTSHGEELIIVTTSHFNAIWSLYDSNIHVWDIKTGKMLGEYDAHTAPEWVVQRWDEFYVEKMGDKFGDFRWASDNELNYWNGIPKFSDRSANPSEPEGLRYQFWEGNLTAVYLFDNKRNEEILELIIIATEEGLNLYSVDHLRLLSPDDAKDAAKVGLPALAEEKHYDAPLALLYRIGKELYYHIPIYIYETAEGHRRYYPAYFALVRASDRNVFREPVVEYGGMLPTVNAVYASIGVMKIPEEERRITGRLIDKDVFGDYAFLKLNTSEGIVDVFVQAEITERLSWQALDKIMDAEINDVITVIVSKDNRVIELP